MRRKSYPSRNIIKIHWHKDAEEQKKERKKERESGIKQSHHVNYLIGYIFGIGVKKGQTNTLFKTEVSNQVVLFFGNTF